MRKQEERGISSKRTCCAPLEDVIRGVSPKALKGRVAKLDRASFQAKASTTLYASLYARYAFRDKIHIDSTSNVTTIRLDSATFNFGPCPPTSHNRFQNSELRPCTQYG